MDPFFDQTMSQVSSNSTIFDERGNGSCIPPAMNPAINIVISIIYIIICVVGLLGNTLVIYVVLRFSKMQTVTNIYIVNLALADECYLIGIPFLVATSILKSWKFGGYMCRLYMTTIGINQFTSSTFITIMSADRYIAICHPISSPKLRTPFISKIVAGAAWVISVIMILPIILYSDAVKDGPTDSNYYSCNIIWPTNNSSDVQGTKQLNTFTIYTFVLTFAIPLTLIFICYVLVVRKLQTVGPKNKSKEKKRSHRKVTKLILTVITVYVFCWLPYWIAQIVLIFQSTNDKEKVITCPKQQGVSLFLLCHLIANLLSNANSAMNPVLYAFLSDNFKKSFLKACICAANKDVNAALQIENSVFPKKLCRSESERKKETGQKNTSISGSEGKKKNEVSQLVSKSDPSNMVSRSNVTYTSDLHLDEDSNGREE
ncbi:class A rhodopsin-like G-protein coupled receptor GPRsms, putative, partial [Pediculus humanus corporis]